MRALKEVRRKLRDPFKYLWNWKKTDPCDPQGAWTGVICTNDDEDDAYLHVQELYVACVRSFVFVFSSSPSLIVLLFPSKFSAFMTHVFFNISNLYLTCVRER